MSFLMILGCHLDVLGMSSFVVWAYSIRPYEVLDCFRRLHPDCISDSSFIHGARQSHCPYVPLRHLRQREYPPELSFKILYSLFFILYFPVSTISAPSSRAVTCFPLLSSLYSGQKMILRVRTFRFGSNSCGESTGLLEIAILNVPKPSSCTRCESCNSSFIVYTSSEIAASTSLSFSEQLA
jgi:hypothetical protein